MDITDKIIYDDSQGSRLVSLLGTADHLDQTYSAGNGIRYTLDFIGDYACYQHPRLRVVEGAFNEIGDHAFAKSDHLAYVRLTDPTTIKDYAFQNCRALSVCDISGMTTIGNSAFEDCRSIQMDYDDGDQRVQVSRACPTSIGDRALRNSTLEVSLDQIQSVGSECFSGNTAMKTNIGTAIILSGLASIQPNSFVGTDLKSISVGKENQTYVEISSQSKSGLIQRDTGRLAFVVPGATTISDSRISDVMSGVCNFSPTLTSVSLVSLSAVPANAFNSCASVKRISIPNVKSIGDRAFCGCSNLTSVTIGSGLSSIGSYAFSESLIPSLDLTPNAAVKLSPGAFSSCSRLTAIHGSERLTTIPADAFSYCSELTGFDVGTDVTSIGWNAFYGCSSLISVHLPTTSSECAILADAFSRSGLRHVDIPKNWKIAESSVFEECPTLSRVVVDTDRDFSLPYSAFSNCSSLTSVSISHPERLMSIEQQAFENTRLRSFTIGANVSSVSDTAFKDCIQLSTITVDPDNARYTSTFDGIEPNKILVDAVDGRLLFVTKGGETIPEGVQSIGEYVFSTVPEMSAVIIPTTLSSGEDVCKSLKSLRNLQKIHVQDGNPALHGTELSDCIIAYETSGDISTLVAFVAKNREYDVPSYVNDIQDGLFANSRLSSIDFSHSHISYIHGNAFEYSDVQTLKFGQSLCSLSYSAFNNMHDIRSIDLTSSSITTLDSQPFNNSDFPKLTTVILPNCLTAIANNRFEDANSSLTVWIDKPMTQISAMDGYPWGLNKNRIKCLPFWTYVLDLEDSVTKHILSDGGLIYSSDEKNGMLIPFDGIYERPGSKAPNMTKLIFDDGTISSALFADNLVRSDIMTSANPEISSTLKQIYGVQLLVQSDQTHSLSLRYGI